MNWFKRKKKEECCTKELEERLWKLENKPKLVSGKIYESSLKYYAGRCKFICVDCKFVRNGYSMRYVYTILLDSGEVYSTDFVWDVKEMKDKTFTIKLDK
jgi:hypothetical protein